MYITLISALMALAGAAIGGLMSMFRNWLSRHVQEKAEWIADERVRRQRLYSRPSNVFGPAVVPVPAPQPAGVARIDMANPRDWNG